MASETTMSALRMCGVKHLFLEIPPDIPGKPNQQFQTMMDRLAAVDQTRPDRVREAIRAFVEDFDASGWKLYHQKTHEERLEFFHILADTVLNAARYGIKVHGADFEAAGLLQQKSLELVQFQQKLLAATKERLDRQYTGWEYLDGLAQWTLIQKVQKELPEDMLSRLNDLQMQERLMHDAEVAEYIRKASGGEPSAIFYGAMHGSHEGAAFDSFLSVGDRISTFLSSIWEGLGLEQNSGSEQKLLSTGLIKALGEENVAGVIFVGEGDEAHRAIVPQNIQRIIIPRQKRPQTKPATPSGPQMPR